MLFQFDNLNWTSCNDKKLLNALLFDYTKNIDENDLPKKLGFKISIDLGPDIPFVHFQEIYKYFISEIYSHNLSYSLQSDHLNIDENDIVVKYFQYRNPFSFAIVATIKVIAEIVSSLLTIHNKFTESQIQSLKRDQEEQKVYQEKKKAEKMKFEAEQSKYIAIQEKYKAKSIEDRYKANKNIRKIINELEAPRKIFLENQLKAKQKKILNINEKIKYLKSMMKFAQADEIIAYKNQIKKLENDKVKFQHQFNNLYQRNKLQIYQTLKFEVRKEK